MAGNKPTFIVLTEYWRDSLQRSVMEMHRADSKLGAMYRARKNLRTAYTARPDYMPEVSRVEDLHGNVLAVYEWNAGTATVELRKA